MSIAPRLRRLLVIAQSFAAATWLVAADYEALPDAALSGGNLTVADAGSGAYLQPAPTLDEAGRRQVAEGHRLFNTHWVFCWFEGGMWGRGPTTWRAAASGAHRHSGAWV